MSLQPPTPDLQPLILGIDPGLRVCGWGLVRGGPRPEYVATGVIRPRTRDSVSQRLLHLNQEIAALIETYLPDEVAIEEQFVGALNPTSALAIGQARAAAVIAAAAHGLEVDYYAPTAVKAAVSGYGQGDKRQVQAMVKLLLGLEAAPEPADAADALAIAICHIGNRKTKSLAANGQSGSRAVGQKASSNLQSQTSNLRR